MAYGASRFGKETASFADPQLQEVTCWRLGDDLGPAPPKRRASHAVAGGKLIKIDELRVISVQRGNYFLHGFDPRVAADDWRWNQQGFENNALSDVARAIHDALGSIRGGYGGEHVD